MALTDLTRISTSGIATGSTIDAPILRKDVSFRGSQVGVTSALFDSSENELKFKDAAKLSFGDSSDFSIYHSYNGNTDTYMDSSARNLYIRLNTGTDNGGNIALQAKKDEHGILIEDDGSVKLYFDGNSKFQTTNHGAVVTGVLTATSFSGGISGNTVGNVYAASGISTFYDLRVSNNLTVEGTTTTLDTNLIGVDRVEIGANSNSVVGVAITQSGTADLINLFDGATKVVTIDDTGKVGLGTDNPQKKLEVYDGDIYLNSTDKKIFLTSDYDQYITANAASNYLVLGTGNDERLRIKSDGTVGIGTNNPLSLLTLGASANPTLEFKDYTNNARSIITGSAGGQLVFQTDIDSVNANSDFIFRADSVSNEIVRFRDSGEVGINSATPTAQLEVKGSGASDTLSFLTKDVNRNNVFWIKDGGRVGLHYSPLVINQDYNDTNTPSGTYFYVHHASHPFIIKNDGKVGIGEDDPDGNKLLIRSASTVGTNKGHIMLTGDGATTNEGPQIVFSESGSGSSWLGAAIGFRRTGGNGVGDLVFGVRAVSGDANTTPTEALRITSAGDVGISSNAPRAKLDVKDANTGKDVIVRVSADNNTPYALVVGNDDHNTTSNRGLAMWVGGSKTHHIAARTSTTASENELKISATDAIYFGTGSSETEALRIDSSGRVLIGNSSTNAQEIGDGTLQIFTSDRKHPAIKVNAGNANGFTMLADVYKADESQVNIGLSYSSSKLVLSTSVKPSDTADNVYLSSQDTFAAKPCALTMDHQGVLTFLNTNTSATTTTDSAVTLTERLVIHSNGKISTGVNNNSYELTIGGLSGGPTLWLRDSGTTGTPRILFGDTSAATKGAIYYSSNNNYMSLYTNGTEHIRIDSSGHFYPYTDATRDLGTSSFRWRNVYTTDLQLSNENTGGNEIDGTEGNWTLQEGESDIYMINRKTGKKYKMMLQEVS